MSGTDADSNIRKCPKCHTIQPSSVACPDNCNTLTYLHTDDNNWHEQPESSTSAFQIFVEGINDNWDKIDNKFVRVDFNFHALAYGMLISSILWTILIVALLWR